MKTKVAKYLSEMMDVPVEKWGTLRAALKYYLIECRELLEEEFLDLINENELDDLYGDVLKKAEEATVYEEVPNEIIPLFDLVKAKGDYSSSQASSLIIEIVRSFIRMK